MLSGRIFQFGPSGTTFDPPSTLTLSYDPGQLPSDVVEGDLRILRMPAPGGRWLDVEGSQLREGEDEVLAPVVGFSIYGLAVTKGQGTPVAFMPNFNTPGLGDDPNRVYLNDGRGNLIDTGQRLGGMRQATAADLGDLDGDGDQDVLVCTFRGHRNMVLMNQPTGTLTDSGQSLGDFNCYTSLLGNLDGN